MQFLEKDDSKELLLLSRKAVNQFFLQFISDIKNIEVNHKCFIDIKTHWEAY